MEEAYPGDDIIPDAVMVYDQMRTMKAPPSDIFPWLQQIGKGRGGWYLPSYVERFLPSSWQASRRIEEQWQTLAKGDRIADYGVGQDDYFDVVEVEPPNVIVFRSERYGCSFSWALLLHDRSSDAAPATTVHLRFRGNIQATGLKRRLIVLGGGWLDYLSTMPMLAGIAERVEKPHSA